MRCPDQDPMFWKPDDVFEISCPKCGYGVEFFKFDSKRRCRCGHEICDIIGHHHHPRKKETLNFQILCEADWLVNMEEGGLNRDPEKLIEIIEKEFKTVTGKKLAKDHFNLQ